MKKLFTLLTIILLASCTSDWTEDYEEYIEENRKAHAEEIKKNREDQCARCPEGYTYTVVNGAYCYTTLTACQESESETCYSCN